MGLQRYGAVLRAPGVARLLVVGFLARGPVIAVSVVLTLHVVLSLDRSYASAGLLATTLTVATAAGAPWRGRVIDRLGLRRALAPSIAIGGGVWLVAPFVSYPTLVGLSVVGGVFGLPSFAVIRQALSVAVSARDRRTTLSLDAISVELSFMTGPAIAVVAATSWSTRGVLFALGVAQIVAGTALWVLNPLLRSAAPTASTERSRAPGASSAVLEPDEPSADQPGRHRADSGGQSARRPWFTPAMLAVFVSGAGATLVLAGSEVAVVAQLRHLGHLSFTGAVFVVWGITSIVGGFVYGALHREISPPVVLLGLAALTVPIGLAGSPLTVALGIGVAGLFCAPALTATSTALTHLVAEESRGEAMGWQGTAMTVGSGIGAPVAGWAADRSGASGGYVAAGVAGLGLALLALGLTAVFGRGVRLGDAEPAEPAEPAEQAEHAGGGAAWNTVPPVAADTLTD